MPETLRRLRAAERNQAEARPLRLALSSATPPAVKTTAVNALTGSNHMLATGPALTVEKKEGITAAGRPGGPDRDLPSIYSLSPIPWRSLWPAPAFSAGAAKRRTLLSISSTSIKH